MTWYKTHLLNSKAVVSFHIYSGEPRQFCLLLARLYIGEPTTNKTSAHTARTSTTGHIHRPKKRLKQSYTSNKKTSQNTCSCRSFFVPLYCPDEGNTTGESEPCDTRGEVARHTSRWPTARESGEAATRNRKARIHRKSTWSIGHLRKSLTMSNH